jgi:hypothetical protein
MLREFSCRALPLNIHNYFILRELICSPFKSPLARTLLF